MKLKVFTTIVACMLRSANSVWAPLSGALPRSQHHRDETGKMLLRNLHHSTCEYFGHEQVCRLGFLCHAGRCN